MVKKINTVVENTTELSDLEKLQKQFDEMSKQMAQLLKNQSVSKTPVEKNELDDDGEDIHINGDTYIKVMSMCPHVLNMTTEPKGRGKLFIFLKLYEVKRILYKDLTALLENHPTFANDGLFLILNKSVVRRHGLDDIYSGLITKETMETIRQGNETDAVNLFKTASQKQQSLIVEQIIDDIVNGKEKDLNYLDRLSRVVGFNIAERAADTKALLETKKE